MDGMVEENGTAGNPGGDPLAHSPEDTNTSVVVTSVQSSSSEQHHLVAATSIVQLTLPTHVNNSTATAQVQSVIQANQQSVIQTAANIQPVHLQKGNVILVSSKPNSVIQTTQGSLQTLQIFCYVCRMGRGESSSDVDTNEDSELSSHSIPSHYQTATVIPAGAIQIASQGETVQGLHTLTMTNATTAGGAIVQYAQGQDGQQFFVPVVTQGAGIGGGQIIAEDQARKREMRLLKNRI
ncbi:hypothetical protein C0J52_06395 [Blattella germanica]|nr:hypothetical protein C0J52_06395 [Blattella germanica]